MMSLELAVASRRKARPKRIAGVLALAVACLPGEPTSTIEFVLPSEATLAIAINTTTTPEITVTVDGNPLPDANYRFESLNDSIVAVNTDGDGLIGLVRDTATIRVVFGDANGEVSDTFRVVGVVSNVQVTSPVNTLLKLGQTAVLTAEALDGNDDTIADTPFVWSSSDSSVVTVDSNGTVTAVGPGEADVRAIVDGVSDSASLVMRIVVTRVEITTQPFVVHALTWQKPLGVFALDVDGAVITLLDETAFTWTSSDPTIAAVDSNGVVTAQGNGTTYVFAELGGQIDSVAVTVDQIALAVLVNPNAARLALTDTTTFTVTVFDTAQQDILNPSVTWSSSNEPVATVSGGLVSALTLGPATITAEVDGILGTAALDVLQPQSLVITPSTKTIDAWLDTTRLVATVRDGSNTVISPVTITWTTNDAAIATVEIDGRDGLVTGRGNGIATITATAPLGVTNTATISVNQLPVSSVAVTPLGLDASTTEGPKGPLVATALDASDNTIPGVVTWRSLNPYRATIDSLTGMVTAHASGQVTMAADIAGVTGYALVTVAAPDAVPVQTWVQESDLGVDVGPLWGLSPTMVWATNLLGIWMYDGSSWSLQTAEPNCCVFWGASGSDVWAAGRNPTRLVHWDGTAWSPDPMTFPVEEAVRAIWGSSPVDVWLASNQARLYHYDGVAWTFAYTLQTSELDDIWGSSADDVWALGHIENPLEGRTNRAIQLFHFDGGGWRSDQEFSNSIPLLGQRMWGISSNDVWTFSGLSAPYATVMSRFDGSGWVPGDTLRYGSPLVWGSSANEMYVVLGFNSGLRVYRFNGGRWDNLPVEPPGFVAWGVWGMSDGPVWIRGESLAGGLLRGVRQ